MTPFRHLPVASPFRFSGLLFRKLDFKDAERVTNAVNVANWTLAEILPDDLCEPVGMHHHEAAVLTFFAKAEFHPKGVSLGSVLRPHTPTPEFLSDKDASHNLGTLGIFGVPENVTHQDVCRQMAGEMMALKTQRYGAYVSDAETLRKLML